MKLLLDNKDYLKVKFGKNKLEIKRCISDQEKLFILEQLEKSYEERIKDNENLISLIAGLDADIEILLCNICVKDVDFKNYKYSELHNSGFISFIKSKVCNFSEIKDSCFEMINMLKLETLIPDMSQFASNDNIIEKISKISNEESIVELTKQIKKISNNTENLNIEPLTKTETNNNG